MTKELRPTAEKWGLDKIIRWMFYHPDYIVILGYSNYTDVKTYFKRGQEFFASSEIQYKINFSNSYILFGYNNKLMFTVPEMERLMGYDAYKTLIVDYSHTLPEHILLKYTMVLRND